MLCNAHVLSSLSDKYASLCEIYNLRTFLNKFLQRFENMFILNATDDGWFSLFFYYLKNKNVNIIDSFGLELNRLKQIDTHPVGIMMRIVHNNFILVQPVRSTSFRLGSLADCILLLRIKYMTTECV